MDGDGDEGLPVDLSGLAEEGRVDLDALHIIRRCRLKQCF